MNGILAQLTALTTYGNDFLKNGRLPVNFSSRNTTFRFCNRVDFTEFSSGFFSKELKPTVVANDPVEWFTRLKKDGCRELRLLYEPTGNMQVSDHKMAGMVGGGGTWLLEAVYKTYSYFWVNRWMATQPNDPDSKVWTVNYGLTVKKLRIKDLKTDLPKAKAQLQGALDAIAAFAGKQGLEQWVAHYQKANAVLDSLQPAHSYYHQDLLPASNYALAAQQLLFAAGFAWAFGGMGSWNDLSFAKAEEMANYDTLSAQLYAAINNAVMCAVNSY